MTWEEMKQIVNEIDFRDWTFELGYDAGWDDHPLNRPRLRVKFVAPDNETGLNREHHGRWWGLSYHMTKGEVLQTALKAVLTTLEHEAREQFLYKGIALYGPHIDPEVLLHAAQKLEVRACP